MDLVQVPGDGVPVPLRFLAIWITYLSLVPGFMANLSVLSLERIFGYNEQGWKGIMGAVTEAGEGG